MGAHRPIDARFAVAFRQREPTHVLERIVALSDAVSTAANASLAYTMPGGVTGSIRAARVTLDPK